MEYYVAPRVGAWIETGEYKGWNEVCPESHPVWVRGLKRIAIAVSVRYVVSHPVWVRGLKPEFVAILSGNNVAPRVGAWIETSWLRKYKQLSVESHPVWVRGLKRLSLSSLSGLSFCRTPCGCVD